MELFGRTFTLINLTLKLQTLIQGNRGITSQPRCRLIGFKEHPLLKKARNVEHRQHIINERVIKFETEMKNFQNNIKHAEEILRQRGAL